MGQPMETFITEEWIAVKEGIDTWITAVESRDHQADMAWATNQWFFNARIGDQAMTLPLRCTWILEKRDGRWMIVHFHKSAGT